MAGIFRTRYRIVTDRYCGYEAQFRPWWCPVWLQIGFSNTHSSVEAARRFIDGSKGTVVEYVE